MGIGPMQIDPIPLFFDTTDLRPPKIDSAGNLENLLSAVNNYDFACILATPDDAVVSRDVEYFAPRDNLLFEFGLFLEGLGRDRVFLIHPRMPGMKLPSDLLGIALLDYKPTDQNNPPEAVFGPVAERIRRAIV